MKLKIENVENQLDIRNDESMTSEIHNYLDDCMLQLYKYKKDLEKYIEILNADKYFF
jgi:hypothetical protein